MWKIMKQYTCQRQSYETNENKSYLFHLNGKIYTINFSKNPNLKKKNYLC